MQHPPMRRKDRALTEEDAHNILQDGQYGVLSSVGPEGAPLGTPLSYVVDGGDIVFHCAKTGHKITNITHQPRVCFTVVDDRSVRPVYDGSFTTLYSSAIAHGTAEPVEDEAEKDRLLRLLCAKYLPAHMDKAAGEIAGGMQATAVWRIRVEHLTAKAKREKPHG